MKKNHVSEAVIRRLPKYYRYLQELERLEVDRISSQELSKKMGIKATQIRQDLNCFGGFGQQGYGYQVKLLKNEIRSIIGLDKTYDAVLVGAGNVGQALANYENYEKEGLHIRGIFDTDPKLIGETMRNVPIMDLDSLYGFVKKHPIDLCIIAVPKEHAQEIADLVIGCGVCAIWNFAPVDVNVRIGVCVENVHLNDSLYTLIYRIGESLNQEEDSV